MSSLVAQIDSGCLATGSVSRLQNELLKMPQADIKTTHSFKPGIYERTIIIPPWTVLTGAEHKTPYRVRLESGSISVNTDDGVCCLHAPYEFDAPAGVQRVGRVYDLPVTWTDIYENQDNCIDIDELEQRLYVIPVCGLGSTRALLGQDQGDYLLFLGQIGLSQDQMDSIVQIEHDLIPMPDGFGVETKNSSIHGNGIFATRYFSAGDLICPGRIDGKRTPAGRFTNHSPKPNAEPRKIGDDISAFALRDIRAGEEIFIDYRDSMLVNFGIDMKGVSVCQAG